MSIVPNRQFSANVGDKSVGNAGPDALEQDIDNLRTWAINHKDSSDTDHDGRYIPRTEMAEDYYNKEYVNDYIYTKTETDNKFSSPVKHYKQPTAPPIGEGLAVEGDTWYDTGYDLWKYCNGTSWALPITDSSGTVAWNSYKQATAPQLQAGDQWFDTTTNRLKVCNGTAWVDLLKYS